MDHWTDDVNIAGQIPQLSTFYGDEFLQETAFELDELIDELSRPAPCPTMESPTSPQEFPKSLQPYSILSSVEEQRLQEIAMPYLMLTQGRKFSLELSPPASHDAESPPSPKLDTRKMKANARKAKKRKLALDNEKNTKAIYQSRKAGHNLIEKKYRQRINEKMNSLSLRIPLLCSKSGSTELEVLDDAEDWNAADESGNPPKYGKAEILTRAMDYIEYLEEDTKRLRIEGVTLKATLGVFENITRSGSIVVKSC
jgi:hypothetical protein